MTSMPSWSLKDTAYCRAAITCVMSAAPFLPAIFSAMMCASGATPLTPTPVEPVPAIMPATKVPWPK